MVVSSVRSNGLDFVKFRIDTLSVNQEKKGLKLLDRFLQVLFVELECFDLWNANMISLLVDSYNKLILVIMEIPSKDHPFFFLISPKTILMILRMLLFF